MCVYGEVVSCFKACSIADLAFCDDESMINATSRNAQVRRYSTLGNTLTEASGVHRPVTAGRMDTASHINLELCSVKATK